jgi:dipeptidyl aminopeptidase/acylaminoacyl peptidase
MGLATVPFTQLRSLRALALAPGADALAFTAVRASLEADAYLSELFLLDLGTRRLRSLTALQGAIDGPVWLDADRLAYAVGADLYEVERSGRVRLRGSAPAPLRQLVVLPGTDVLLGTVSAMAPAATAPFVTRSLPYKQDGRGRIHGPDRLVAMRADGATVDLGPGYAPSPAPGGRALAHLAVADRLEFGDADLVVRDLDPVSLEVGEARGQAVGRSVLAMAWSPAGELATLTAFDFPGTPTPAHLLVGRPDATYRDLAATEVTWLGSDGDDWAPGPSRVTLAWLDGERLLALDQRGGSVQPVALSAGGVRRLSDVDGVVSDAIWEPGAGVLYAVLESPTRAHEIVRVGAGGDVERLTDLNPYAFPAPEHFTVPGAGEDGEAVDVYALFAGDGPGPTVFSIHGGPHGAFLRGVNLDHHVVRDAGVSVVWANPHGSTGHSRAFAAALVGRWGELDELEWRQVRARLAEMGREASSLGVWGTSYGGFMATWLAGRLEDVKAAVIQAPVLNKVSQNGASDLGYTSIPRSLGFDGGAPADVASLDAIMEAGWKNSPLRFYPDIQAATLILVGDRDDRCPVNQAEQLYTLLRHRDRQAVELVIYPGETHGLGRQGRPRTREDRWRRTAAWLADHLGAC